PEAAVDDVNAYNGKVLRVNKADGRGFADNPFYDKNLDSVASRVWALGLRNPFRFTFAPSGQPANGLFIAENGDQQDRFFQIEEGANGGWNQGRDNGEAHPKDPHVHILGLHKPSMTGIAIAEKGPFAGPNGEPVLYVEHWYSPEEIIRGILGTPEGGQQYSTFTPIPGDTTKVPDEKPGAVGGPYGVFAVHLKCVNMKFGPDGNLYINNASWGPAKGNGFILGRIKYVGAAAAPIATGTAPATSGTNK
ncbi:MAG TPA: PQQ-dependent sugar dehydrogenase, partial [Verrucomicrobiae bacterium]|nr:PQQ-dependent sugar dehydrogenase [Verrucomicrobiae bacterium]